MIMSTCVLTVVSCCFITLHCCSAYPLSKHLDLTETQQDILTAVRNHEGFHVIYNNGFRFDSRDEVPALFTGLKSGSVFTIALTFLNDERSDLMLTNVDSTAFAFVRYFESNDSSLTIRTGKGKRFNWTFETEVSIFRRSMPAGRVQILQLNTANHPYVMPLLNGERVVSGEFLNKWEKARYFMRDCQGRIEIHEYHHTFDPVESTGLSGPDTVFPINETIYLPEAAQLSGGAVIRLKGRVKKKRDGEYPGVNLMIADQYVGHIDNSGNVDTTVKIFDTRVVVHNPSHPMGLYANNPYRLGFDGRDIFAIGHEFLAYHVEVHTGSRPVDKSSPPGRHCKPGV